MQCVSWLAACVAKLPLGPNPPKHTGRFASRHLRVVGEWFSIPLIAEAGSTEIGDAIYDSIQHPIGIDLIARCDGALRLAGDSGGADLMVQATERMGKPVWFELDQLPTATPRDVPAA